MTHYEIILFAPYTAQKIGTVIVTNEEQMIQEVKDHIRDGFGVYVVSYKSGTVPMKPNIKD